MEHELTQASGWLPNGYQAMLTLATWIALAMAHAAWRSVAAPEPDPIRPSGPIE